MRTILIYFSIILILGSCKTQNLFKESRAERKALAASPDSAFIYDSAYQYTIRKDDKINISIWGQDELSVGSTYGIYNSNEAYGKWLLVDANGNIEIPKTGTLRVLNLTVPQLKDTIRIMLSRWIANPIVDIKVLNKNITVLGEVRNPALVQVDKDRISLLDLIAKTEGYEFYANLKNIKIIRQEDTLVRVAYIDLTRAGDYQSRNIKLHPGDVVVLTSKHNKEFDRRISTIIPFATSITAMAILFGLFL